MERWEDGPRPARATGGLEPGTIAPACLWSSWRSPRCWHPPASVPTHQLGAALGVRDDLDDPLLVARGHHPVRRQVKRQPRAVKRALEQAQHLQRQHVLAAVVAHLEDEGARLSAAARALAAERDQDWAFGGRLRGRKAGEAMQESWGSAGPGSGSGPSRQQGRPGGPASLPAWAPRCRAAAARRGSRGWWGCRGRHAAAPPPAGTAPPPPCAHPAVAQQQVGASAAAWAVRPLPIPKHLRCAEARSASKRPPCLLLPQPPLPPRPVIAHTPNPHLWHRVEPPRHSSHVVEEAQLGIEPLSHAAVQLVQQPGAHAVSRRPQAGVLWGAPVGPLDLPGRGGGGRGGAHAGRQA